MTGAFQAKPARDPPHLCRSSKSRAHSARGARAQTARRLPLGSALCPGQSPRPAVSLVLCLPGCAFAPRLLEAPSSHSVPGLPWVAPWVPSTCQALRQLTCSVVFTSCHRSQDSSEGESVSSVQESCVPLTEEGLVQARWDHRSPEGTPSRPHPGATCRPGRGSTLAVPAWPPWPPRAGRSHRDTRDSRRAALAGLE